MSDYRLAYAGPLMDSGEANSGAKLRLDSAATSGLDSRCR